MHNAKRNNRSSQSQETEEMALNGIYQVSNTRNPELTPLRSFSLRLPVNVYHCLTNSSLIFGVRRPIVPPMLRTGLQKTTAFDACFPRVPMATRMCTNPRHKTKRHATP